MSSNIGNTAQTTLDDSYLVPKAMVFILHKFFQTALPDLKIYGCRGTQNEKGEFGTCFFTFAGEGTPLDNTYVYVLRQDSKEDIFWLGHTNRDEPY